MKKIWIALAIVLIVIGIGGAAAHGFRFDDPKFDFKKEWTFDDHAMQKLDIRADNQSTTVDFAKSPDGSNHVRIEGKAKQTVIDQLQKVQVANGSLNIDLNPPNERWVQFGFDFFGSKQHVTVELTDEAAKALDSVLVKQDAGSLTVNGATARIATFTTDAGSIRIAGYRGEQLTLQTDAGSIKAEDIVASLDASTDAGTINVQHLTGVAKLHSDAGSIKLQKEDVSDADIQTDAGSVRVTLPKEYDGRFDLRSDAGSVHAPDDGPGSSLVKVRTDSGSIRVALAGDGD